LIESSPTGAVKVATAATQRRAAEDARHEELSRSTDGGVQLGRDQPLRLGVRRRAGLTAASLAKRRRLTVLATTRPPAKAGALREAIEEIAQAHDDIEHDRFAGKLVVSTGR
jgi:hypothetical protein